ncbi:cytochrome P450 [Mycena galericulata]|nr:cytochrome P450 [Mycena galericulata]
MLNESGALTACGLTLVAIIWISHRFSSSPSLLELIPGPKCTSWVYGNMPQLLLPERYGEHEFQWQETYGQVYLIKGCFGESRLMVSDPSAVKFIANSGIFAIGPSLQKIRNALFGPGSIASARGEAHRHLRSIMNPSFSASNIRALLPVVKDTARALAERWEALGFPGNTVDISGTLHDAALDVMGNAVLEHPFNALGGQSELARVQRTIMDAVSNPTRSAQLVDAALPYVPDFILNLAWRLPLPGIQMITALCGT